MGLPPPGDAPSQPAASERRHAAQAVRVLVVVILLLIVWEGREVFLLFFAGVLLALLFSRLTDALERRTPLPRGGAYATVLLLLAGLVAGAVWLAAPSVNRQLDELSQRLPQAVAQLRERAQGYTWSRNLLEQAPDPQKILDSSPQALSQATTVLSSTVGAVGALIVVLVVALYLGAQLDLYRRGLLRLVPLHRRARAREVLDETVTTLEHWLSAQLLSMAIVGLLITLGLWWIGVPLALLLGLLAALLEFVPNFGPILSAVPALLLALAASPRQALWVVLLYIGVQTAESYLITPLVQRRLTHLPPVLVIVSQLLGGVLFGILGFALATPLLVVVMVLVKRLYIEDRLGDPLDEPGEEAPSRNLRIGTA